MKTLVKSAALAAGLAAAATSASAVTTLSDSGTFSLGDDAFVAFTVDAGETVTFTFQNGAGVTALVQNVAFSATGRSGGTDISELDFGFDGDLSFAFGEGDIFLGPAGFAFGSLGFDGFELGPDGVFSFSVFNGSDVELAPEFVFETAAVPVPAAGLLLLTALIGAGAAARRKAAKA